MERVPFERYKTRETRDEEVNTRTRELIERIKQGDEQARNELLMLYWPWIVLYFYF